MRDKGNETGKARVQCDLPAMVGDEPIDAMRLERQEMARRLSEAYSKLAGMQALQRRLDTLEHDARRMRSEIEDRYSELATLESMLEQARGPAAIPHGEPAGDDAGRGMRGMRGIARRLAGWRRRKRLEADIRDVRASGLFDAAWYLETYPDVAASGQDPVFHYVRFGASEGRGVGPRFDVSEYLRAHPSAAAGNPILHYLSSTGRAPGEGQS